MFNKIRWANQLMLRRFDHRKIAGIMLITTLALASCQEVGVSDVLINNKTATTQQSSSASTITPIPSATPTNTPTQLPTQTSTPTETATPTASPTPMIEGDIEKFMEDEKDRKVLETVLEIQRIVNGYDSNSGLSFQEYTAKLIEEIGDSNENKSMKRLLEVLGEYDKINSLFLAKVLKENIPQLGIINIDNWPEEWLDDTSLSFVFGFSELAKEHGLPQGFMGGDRISNGWIVVGDIPINKVSTGDLIFNFEDDYPTNKNSDYRLFIVLSEVKIENSKRLLVTGVNEERSMELIEINQDNYNDVFGSGIIVNLTREL